MNSRIKDRMTITEFLLWFYKGQTKQWLANELTKDTIVQMNPKQLEAWKNTAKACDVEIVDSF